MYGSPLILAEHGTNEKEDFYILLLEYKDH